MDNKAINFDELFKLYYRALCIYATHYLHNIDIAEDIVQECFSTLWEESVQKHKEIINIRAYLYTMVRNSSLDHLRKESVFDKDISPSDLEETLTDEEAEERSFTEARLWTAIDALPEKCREIFLLNKRDGLKYKEIAEMFHISVHTVDNHISKALRLIREGARKVYLFFFN